MGTGHDYDVAVAGGGVAGAAAAVAAARLGAKTVLIEKTCTPGGLASAGLINIYLPLCDGNGTQVTFGIAEELMRRALKYGPGTVPPDWMANAMRRRRSVCAVCARLPDSCLGGTSAGKRSGYLV